MSSASMNLSGDDQSLDSLATSSIGFSDLEDQTIDLPDDSLSSNIENSGGAKSSKDQNRHPHHRRSTSASVGDNLDVSTHDKANAAQAVASDLAREDQAVARSRFLVFLVLLVVAAFLGVATYWFLSEDLNERIQQDFEDVAHEIAAETQQRLDIVKKKLETWSTMATIMASSSTSSSFSSSSANNTTSSSSNTWPFVTLPYFSSWVGGTSRNGGWNIQQQSIDVDSSTLLLPVESVTLGVIVPDNELNSWNGYSSQMAPSYVLQEIDASSRQKSLLISGDSNPATLMDASVISSITPYIWKYDQEELNSGIHDNDAAGTSSNNKIVDRGPASEYAISWQSTPLQPNAINYNDLASSSFQVAYNQMKESSMSSMSGIIYSEGGELNLPSSSSRPRTLVLQPIFESIVGNNKNNIVGYMKAILSWETLFDDLLPEDMTGIQVDVQESGTCRKLDRGLDNRTITYQLDGKSASQLSSEDLRADTGTNSVIMHTLMGSSRSGSMEQDCEYTIIISSTDEFRQGYDDQTPLWYAIIGVSTVVVTAMAFALYNCFVQKRQRKLMDNAAKSHALVDSLFPANVRDRLMRESGNFGTRRLSVQVTDLPKDGDTKPKSNFLKKATSSRKLTSTGTPTTVASADDINGNKQNQAGKLDLAKIMKSKPIADLFPRCTVLFADIVGFTAWSSVRDPTQVFTLLETLYNSFDSIAKRRGVFKVETIGDCYVAATGLPEPRDDHAVVMAKFARDCMHRMLDLVHKLEVVLGPDTGDLSMRFGLHSGPVTAGVLRGAKSRFQLFGDTVNTAARIESSGMKTKIHISKETADLIIEAGKQHWVRPRETKIHAKGKGKLQTYWLEIKPGSKDSHESLAPRDFDSIGGDSASSLNIGNLGVSSIVAKFEREHKENRLDLAGRRQVDYNVEVLHGMLKKVLAMRDPSHVTLAVHTNEEYLDGFRALSTPTDANTIILDEVKDSIVLPKEAEKYKQDPDSVVLNDKAASQLRDFVTTVASMYNKHQFHCFEHAGHTTMSVTKLMSRLITSDTIDYNDMSYKKKAGTTKLHQCTYGITSDPLTQFAVAFSSLIHDIDHPGIPNSQIMLQDEGKAKNYRNRCISEQNSVEIAWTLLMEPAYEDLRMCIYTTQAELDRFRQIVVNAVIATDFFDEELKARRLRRWEEAFRRNGKDGGKQHKREPARADESSKKAALVIEYMIQASDISHTMQHWNVYIKWNKRLYLERYDAFKSGKSAKDPTTDWYQTELDFFDNIVIPLAKNLLGCEVFGSASEECLAYATANRRDWASKGRDMVKEYSNVCRRVGGKKLNRSTHKGSMHTKSNHSSYRSFDSSSRDMMSSFGSSSFALNFAD